ncbi:MULTISPECIES: barstar family protein [Streptomyces]|uniref:barstar family protein n=1 Tax=Streptomyces TaxID=1883 RepID=UPI00163CC711|nr:MULTISPECIES: barstar family protein [Streptomyces]MBC2878603.1 barstar family protein [Streptomyces sp. TYQ1024]UBI35259.1 barstar family protein [Streptomyces mobaraensis]UKW27849.1 barstar family protein [Streptomyces sp. TYQ1024]
MTNSELTVDLRGRLMETLDDFWDAVAKPCGLPEWFGRNLDAWADTIGTRGISEVIDRHDLLVVHVGRQGLFDGSRPEGDVLAGVFDGERNRLVVHAAA